MEDIKTIEPKRFEELKEPLAMFPKSPACRANNKSPHSMPHLPSMPFQLLPEVFPMDTHG